MPRQLTTMNSMSRNNYEAPLIAVASMELSGFICTSIQKMMLFVEVDEYQNMGEEALNFDSD